MTFLFIAYSLLWLGVLTYALMMSRENRRLAAQVEALSASIGEGSVSGGSYDSGGRGSLERG